MNPVRFDYCFCRLLCFLCHPCFGCYNVRLLNDLAYISSHIFIIYLLTFLLEKKIDEKFSQIIWHKDREMNLHVVNHERKQGKRGRKRIIKLNFDILLFDSIIQIYVMITLYNKMSSLLNNV